LSSGTAFFYDAARVVTDGARLPVLVTNRHVIEGATNGFVRFIRAEGDAPLWGEPVTASFTVADWVTHPDPAVDVAVTFIGPTLQGLADQGLPVFYRLLGHDLVPTNDVVDDLDVVEPVTFVGYPRGLFDTVNLTPIIRRGTTATPVQLDYCGMPAFLVDASIFPGSSGSPVFIVNENGYRQGNTIASSGAAIMALNTTTAASAAERKRPVRITTYSRQRRASDKRAPAGAGPGMAARSRFGLPLADTCDYVPPSPTPSGFHVPFDELTDTQSTEQELIRAIRAIERVAVAGRSGVGKTSLIQYVMDSLTDTTAAIRIPVEAESSDTVSEPKAFAGHLLRTLARYLHEAKRIDPAARRNLVAGSARTLSVADRRSTHGGFGLPQWLLRADVASDVESVVTADVLTSAGDVIAQARDVVDAIAARGLTSVLVIDDSDAWLATPAGDRTGNVGPFFTRIVRMLAEEFNAALVVAVHDHYRELPQFPVGIGFLETTVHLPPLPSPEALARILDARITTFDFDGVQLGQVVEEPAVAALFERYTATDGNIRATLLTAHTALQAACDDHADGIAATHIQIALTRYDDTYSD